MKKKPSPPSKTPKIQLSPGAALYAAIARDAAEQHIGIATRIKQILANHYGV